MRLRHSLFLLILFCFAPKAHAGTATPVICPSNGAQALFGSGNYANCEPSPVLAFGKQGTSTTSGVLTISVNNCVNVHIPACSGSGSLTLGTPYFSPISGTNAADFANTGAGTCSNGLVLASGQSCTITLTFTPTQTSGTNETATLTINDDGTTASQSLSLAGTSATVTLLASSSCPSTLSSGVNYQLTADITCSGEVFSATSTSNVDLNLNGHTLTWGNGANASWFAGIETASTHSFTLHNGVCTEGAGPNTGTLTNNTGAGCIGSTSNSALDRGDAVFNVSGQCNSIWCKLVWEDAGSTTGSEFVNIHDVVFTDSDTTSCANTGCRENSQGYPILLYDNKNEGPSQIYNNFIVGGPQGSFSGQATGSFFQYNVVNNGTTTTSVTNGFGYQEWGSGFTINHNLDVDGSVGGSCTACRGIQISNIVTPVTGALIENNTILATGLNNDAEYNCTTDPEAATFGMQLNTAGSTKTPFTNNIMQNNNVIVTTTVCGGYGFSWSAANGTGNETVGNHFECDASTTLSSQQVCAGWGGASKQYTSVDFAVTSQGDTILGDGEAIFIRYEGCNATTFSQDTFGKGTNPQAGWQFINYDFGRSSGASVNPFAFVDPTFTGGATESMTNMATWAAANPTLTAQYTIEFTQTVHVQNSSAVPIAGASVIYTDALSNTYPCTTDGSGNCKVIVNENQYSASGGTTTTTHYNNYARAVSATGYTTNNASGISVTTPNSVTVTLMGGTVPVIPAPSGLVATVSEALMTCVETLQDMQIGWNKNFLVNDACQGGEAICQCY